MPVVRAVPVLVILTIAAVDVDLYVALGAPLLPAPVLVKTVYVPVPAAPAEPVASAGRAAPASAVAPIAAAAFAAALALAAPVQPDPEPATPVALPVAPAVPDAGPSLSDAMVRDEKLLLYPFFTCFLVLLS